jgi:phenylacetate-coenzyme A ligase PaaK-like adenylate-forming protein
MAKTFMPSFENLDELRQHQLKGLQWTVNHAYRGSSHYRKSWKQPAFVPKTFERLEDIRKLPFTTTDDLRKAIRSHFLRFPNPRWLEFMPLPVPRANGKF